MNKLLLLALLVLPCAIRAQVVGPGFVNYVTSAPSGTCSQGEPQRNVLGSGFIYSCQSGSWAQVGAGGGGTVTSVSGTANQINVATGTTTPVISLSSTIVVPGTITSAAYATSGANGGISGIEGSGAGLTPAAGTDLLYPDSVSHCWHSSQNNVDVGCVDTASNTITLTNKTLTTPTIGSFTNATHTHQNAAGGGTLDGAAIAAGSIAIARGGTGTTLGALSIVPFITTAAITNNTTQYQGIGTQSVTTTEANVESPMPVAGIFSNCRVIYISGGALTGGMSEVITFRKNAGACGSPGTVTLTLNSSSTLGPGNNPITSDTTNSCTVAIGDYVDLQSVPASTPTAARFVAVCQFQPN